MWSPCKMLSCKLAPAICTLPRTAKLLQQSRYNLVECLVKCKHNHAGVDQNQIQPSRAVDPERHVEDKNSLQRSQSALNNDEETLGVPEQMPFNYSYFRQIIKEAVSGEGRSVPQTAKAANPQAEKSLEVSQADHGKPNVLNLSHIKPKLPAKHEFIAVYVNESETLQKLVQLGVDLSVIHKYASADHPADNLVKSDFERDIKPYLMFLIQHGVPESKLGHFITKNPAIFKEPLQNLEIRINYLESKRFPPDNIARILTYCPQIMSLSTKELDSQLGFIQKEFKLTGAEVRVVVFRTPRITLAHKYQLHEANQIMQGIIGFTQQECKTLLLGIPKIFLEGRVHLEERFDYIHNVMGISHELILAWPNILRTRLVVMKPRHQFLKALGLDQFDPQKENYVSLKDLVTNTDPLFSILIAKQPVEKYNEFLKTL